MRILHLYYDFMNLYGEYANVSALERLFTKSGIDCTVDKMSFSDTPKLKDYDIIYMGSGTERNLRVVLEDMRKYRDDLKEYIADGKVLLMTGNSFELTGKTLTAADGSSVEGLGLYDFTVTEQNKTRTTSDAIFTADFSEKPLVGFINKCSSISGIKAPLFSVKMGLGNDEGGFEGIRDRNFFGTHLTGPVLIKNPHFLCYIAGIAAGEGAVLSEEHLGYEKAGYEITLTELTAVMNKTN